MIPTDFFHPERLWAFVAVPILLVVYFLLVWMKDSSQRQGPPSSLHRLIRRQAAWKRHIAVGAAVLSLCSLIIAWATPKGFEQVPRDRATVVITIDVSKSMVATDVEPSRLAAAQDGAKQFLQQLPTRFNVALVAFAGTANLLVPPTTDRGTVSRAIDNLVLAPSTAIGEGIYTSLDALNLVPPDPAHPDEAPPAVIVLLSDGESNLGRTSLSAAQSAKTRGVPVFTIAYGTQTGYVEENGRRILVPVNKTELRRIAEVSGGEALTAETASDLKRAYESIASSIGYERVETEITEKYAGTAFLFGVIAALATVALGGALAVTVADNLAEVRARIERACDLAGRDPASVRLLAVSKTWPAASVREALAAGCTDFGENRVAELVEKSTELADTAARWTLIGHLQRNKAGHAVAAMDELQSLDSLRLAADLDKRLTTRLPVLVQVNTSGEQTKEGLAPAEVLDVTAELRSYEHLDLRGLMTIAMPSPDPEPVARCFDTLARLREQLRDRDGGGWDELSMGMSQDMELAIEHGSTCVRVGTAIFGRRG